MATALEKFTNIATGNITKEDVFGETGTVKLPETLTNIPEAPIEDESPLNLVDEQERQAQIVDLEESQFDDIAPSVAGINAQLEANEPPEAPAITTQTGLTEQLTTQLETLTGKADATADALEAEGVSVSEQQLADLNVDIAGLTAEFDELSSAQEGIGRTKIFTAGRQAQIQRQKAVVLSGKATLALALQGNITAARARAQETVDLEFGETEQRIANTRELLELNEPAYTAAQNKEAARVKADLDERQRLINEDKKDELAKRNLMIMAAQNNADTATLQNILNSETPELAVLAAKTYLGTQFTGETPEKIGTDGDGNDLFYYNGEIVSGNEMLGVDFNSTIGLFSPDVESWAKTVRDGVRKFSDVPDNLKTDVNTMISMLPPPEREIKNAQKMIDTLKQLKKHQGLGTAVDPSILNKLNYIPRLADWITGTKAAFLGRADQYISSQALQSLIDSKKDGATFGALSDRELQVLSNAATALAGWDVRKDGKLVGFRVSEREFKAEMDRIIADYQEVVDEANAMKNDPMGISGEISFNQDLSKSQNYLGNFGQITGYGSPLWRHGLDVDLKIGDPVQSPVTGFVEFVGNNGGFGKQVRIKTNNGNSVWLSHLDSFNVKQGDRVNEGQLLARGGNTGSTIPGVGGDGSHLDITVRKPDGTYFTPQEIHNILA